MPRTKRGTPLAEELGNRVREARELARLSQEKLGELAGVHRTYIGHLERGEVNATIYSIVRVAVALELDPTELVKGMDAIWLEYTAATDRATTEAATPAP